ncbi:MAG: twin transmembrane helix small protein [Nitratireductor sp.]
MNIFASLIPVALAAVVIVLALGLWNMKRGGSANRSQNLMRLRILFQFIAVVIVMTALFLSGRG